MAICLLCKEEISIIGGNTSTMTRHAQIHHKEEWKEIEKSTKQPTISSMMNQKSPTKKYPLKSKKRDFLNRKLVRFIVNLRPLYTVTKKGFKDFIAALDPQYVLPTRKTLRNVLIPKIHAEVMGKVQAELDEAKHCSITTDGWSSLATDKYNAFTVHYVDWKVGELKSKVLECSAFEEGGGSDNLEKEVRRVAEKYNVSKKIVLNVADNAPDIQKALQLFGSSKIGCFAHKYNIAAKYAIDNTPEIQDVKNKLSKLVRMTRVSPKAKKAFQDCLKKVGYKGKL